MFTVSSFVLLPTAGEKEGGRFTLAHAIFLLYWLLKPFYVWSSGQMQPADFVFVAAFLVWILLRRGSIVIDKREFSLIAFVAAASVINGVYFLLLRDKVLVYSIAYYVYCLLVVILVRDLMRCKPFLRGLMWVSALNLIVQLFVLLMGMGQYMWRGFRFMGTFNDPNQYAFSMFSSFILVFILASYFKELEKSRKKMLVLLIFFLAAYFIVQGGSTGMLLGLGAFVLLFLLTVFYSERTPAFQLLKMAALIVFALILVFVFVQGLDSVTVDASADSSSFLVSRLFEKADLVESGGIMRLFQDRALDKLVNYPIYLLFGSGEGAHGGRFGSQMNEVHSTFPGILFYYGIITFLILLYWIRGNLRNASRILIPVYLALLVESLTLAHQRQPAFWIIIMLGSLPYENPRALRKYRINTGL